MSLIKAQKHIHRKPTGKRLEVTHVDEPELLRELFPYNAVPKVAFDHKSVVIDPPEEFWITDTTFRDGQQARKPYTAQQIADIYKMLHRLGGDKGVIKQCEFFLYSDKDREAIRLCQKLGFNFPEITGWIRAVESDLELVKQMGLKETGILTSLSDYHVFLKMGTDRKKIVEKYLAVVNSAIDAEIIPRCGFEDVTRADIYGFVVPFAQKLMEIQNQRGMPIKIRLCDTMGYGVPWPEAALPRSVPKLVNVMVHEAKVPKEQLEFHTHNDFHKVVINATTAWLYGCAGANGALLGFGERTGNTPIEGLCIEYASLRGSTNGMDLSVITEIGDYYRKVLGDNIPKNYPFIGEEFNLTRAGIHADGTIKNEEIYNIFDTTKILNRPIGIGITDKSGRAGVVLWINSHLKPMQLVDKNNDAVGKIYEVIMAEYSGGRTTDISNDEMKALVRKFLPNL